MISHSMQAVLQCLRPHGPEGTASFPPGGASSMRHGKQREPLSAWFSRCVDTHLGGDPAPCQLEANIALLSEVRWQDDTSIQYANMQAIVVLNGNLADLYCGEQVCTQYLRLDFDPNNLGLLFREPHPHIHVHPTGEPRLAMTSSGNVVVAFLELLYRNYHHDAWQDWVTGVWNKRAPEAGKESDPLRHILRAFQTNKGDVLRERYAEPLGRLRQYLRAEADAAYPGRVDEQWLSLLDYSL